MKMVNYIVIGGVAYVALMMMRKPKEPTNSEDQSSNWNVGNWVPIASGVNPSTGNQYEVQERIVTTSTSTLSEYKILKNGVRYDKITYRDERRVMRIFNDLVGSVPLANIESANPIGDISRSVNESNPVTPTNYGMRRSGVQW